ncbi:hypothetical protein LF1_53090 [Rubripirellula obstinata]|uniref:Leucine Rich repeats (2 copies) n=1 Tax=Rubripirellula obstinata TaxID=406547 RepID=A0A5B1CCX8_9BACT|nr:hypothetical protein [Rubripirellula obstinata]KAA1257460.1 hypothetical protein LF1_53090 [Rubripirellula obstinata]
MTIARDRLKLRDFTPLEHEFDAAQKLGELTGRFAIDDVGSIVKLYIRDKLTDGHTDLVLALPNLQFYSSANYPASASGISDCGMARIISHPSLVDVLYQGNERLTGSFFDALRPNSHIKRIGVPYCPIDDAGISLAGGCSLTHLSIRGSFVSDDSVDTLCSMRSLMQIHVKETRITRNGLVRLRESLPGCWIDMLDRPDGG